MEGHDFHGQLMKYMCCVLEDGNPQPTCLCVFSDGNRYKSKHIRMFFR